MIRIRAAAFVAVLSVCALTGACTSSADSESSGSVPSSASETPGSEPEESVTLTRPDAKLDLDISQLRGGVPPSARPRLARELAQPITGWIDAGFLVDDYPTDAFPAAFDTWTAPAAVLGQRDDETTTMAAQGGDLVAVVADQQRVRLFVFAEGGEPGGATARVVLRMTGEKSDGHVRHFEVSGELYLTPAGDTWKIFGYDLHRSVRP